MRERGDGFALVDRTGSSAGGPILKLGVKLPLSGGVARVGDLHGNDVAMVGTASTSLGTISGAGSLLMAIEGAAMPTKPQSVCAIAISGRHITDSISGCDDAGDAIAGTTGSGSPARRGSRPNCFARCVIAGSESARVPSAE